jgi:hypothetical protein
MRDSIVTYPAYFTGTRCFSSSSQFRTMFIFCGPPPADAADTSFIIRNRLPSWLNSGACIACVISSALRLFLRPHDAALMHPVLQKLQLGLLCFSILLPKVLDMTPDQFGIGCVFIQFEVPGHVLASTV